MSKRAKTSKVKSILNTALGEASNSKYCLNCTYSYLQPENGHGYCKYQQMADDKPIMHLKPITDFDTCDHWERKK